MRTTVGKIKELIQEDLFDYTGKRSEKPVGGQNAGLQKVGKAVGMLKTTVEKLENAVRDGDEHVVSQYIERVKQFTKAAEAALYGQN